METPAPHLAFEDGTNTCMSQEHLGMCIIELSQSMPYLVVICKKKKILKLKRSVQLYSWTSAAFITNNNKSADGRRWLKNGKRKGKERMEEGNAWACIHLCQLPMSQRNAIMNLDDSGFSAHWQCYDIPWKHTSLCVVSAFYANDLPISLLFYIQWHLPSLFVPLMPWVTSVYIIIK